MASQQGDDSARLLDAIASAGSEGRPLSLQGSGSKSRRFPTLHPNSGSALSTREHSGVLYYAPDELVLEARSGTPLADLNALLAEHQQQLAFEPPLFRRGGTLGGAVASGLAGPARPWAGAPRDAVLGVELINGLGERVRFGGRVVKNVAGYDLARLQAGAFGTLGCLLSIAVRVMPLPPQCVTLVAALAEDEVRQQLAAWHLADLPITGTAWLDGELYLRLAGPAPAVESAVRRLEADVGARGREATGFWASLRDLTHPFFANGPAGTALYRCSVPVGTPPLALDAPCLSEWRCAQRWYWLTQEAARELALRCEAAGGWQRAVGDPALTLPGNPVVAELQRRVREAFDPSGLFNAHLLADAH